MCQICGGVGIAHPVECHEIWHYDDIKLIQKLKGMIALCPSCHSVKHYGLTQLQGREAAALKHFMKVNKMSKADSEKYVKETFQIWKDRSFKSWELDISILKGYGVDVDALEIKRKNRSK